MTRRHHLRFLPAAIALLVLATVAAPSLSAQPSGTTVGIGVGPITAYPDEFESGGCEGRYVGFNVGAGRSWSNLVAIEGSLTWTGSFASSCTEANDALSLPAPMDGATYRRTSVGPRIPGETFWAGRIGAVLTPWTAGPVSPLVRVTGGRLWTKDLWTWTVGAGLRYGLGRQAVVLDVELWNLAYDVTRETWIYRETDDDELQSSEVVRLRPRPWFIRLGWELAVGR
jgi:hypothetical protein